MSNRRFILFFLVGIAVLSVALGLLSWRSRAVASETTRNTLCVFAPEAVDGLDILRGGENPIRLARDGGGAWNLAAPYAAPADSAAVARLVDALTLLPLGDMRTEAELAELHEDLVDFGLSGAARVMVDVRAGERTARILFGARTASGREVYARATGLRNVFTLPVEAIEAIPADADGFRRRGVVTLAREEIAGLDLRVPESPFMKLERRPGGWRLLSPVEAPADGAAVEALVKGLGEARVGKFVLPSAAHPPTENEAKDKTTELPSAALAPYGLAAGAGLSVTVRTVSGAREQVVFGSSAGTNLVYALVQNGTAVVALEAAVADLCRASGASLRDTRVFPLGANERVNAISLTEGDLIYVLARGTNDVWRLVAPVAAPTDPVVASAWVDRVLHVRRNDVQDGVPEDEAIRISVETAAGALPSVMVSRKIFEACGPLVNLRSKVLLEIDAAAVWRMSAKPAEGGGVAVVRDDARGAWNLAGGTPATVNSEAVKRLLTALARVEAEGVETVAASPEDRRRCGLDVPFLQLAVDFTGSGAIRRTLLLGGVAPSGGRYATVGGADAVFILSRATVAALTISITE